MTKARDIADGAAGTVNLSGYATTSDLNNYALTTDLAGYATTSALATKLDSNSTLNPANLDDTGTIPSALLAGVGGGKVLQVVSNTAMNPISVNTQNYNSHIYGNVSITPSQAGSKILVMHTAPSQVYVDNTTNMGHVAIFRGATNITTNGHNGSFASYDQVNHCQGSDITVLDTPTYTLTDTLDYSVRCKVDNPSLTMIYGTHYSNLAQPKMGGLTLIEIAA